MSQQISPLISPETKLPEVTLKVILLSIILTIVLAASNTYLALKIGILTSASIPAAIISMGILRFFKQANILENNLVQTAASAGEAVAGGIVYTIPALIIIHYWQAFSYWENVAIALAGGVLGVLFSVPLRRVLMTERHLNFPEGKAIAEVLKASHHQTAGTATTADTIVQQAQGFKQLLSGGLIGGLLELAQNGFKIIASDMQCFFVKNNIIYGFGSGFSATLIGAGYIIGFNVGLSIFIGAITVWGIGLPVLTVLSPMPVTNAADMIANVYSEKIHYIGIGAMLTAGLWTLLTLLKPFYDSLKNSLQALLTTRGENNLFLLRTEQDIPIQYIIAALLAMLILLYFFLSHVFPLSALMLPDSFSKAILVGGLIYIFIVGFIFAVICSYFSGLVGVSASPGSAVIIAGMLLAALLLRALLHLHYPVLGTMQLLSAAAITIIIGAIITGAACIANDNIQDLKVGHIIGATPWKQQLMLLFGVLIAALVIPPVMQLLFNAYGIAQVLPHAGMDPSQSLAAPPAAIMAAITQGVFNHDLPWNMLGLGAMIIIVFILYNAMMKIRQLELSMLAIAIGMYLPLNSSVPLFIGGLFALLSKRALLKNAVRRDLSDSLRENLIKAKWQRSLLLACGLVAGAALMSVLLAIPIGLSGNPDLLAVLPKNWQTLANSLGVLTVIALGYWFYYLVKNEK